LVEVDQVDHALEFGTVLVCAGISVIDKFLDVPVTKLRMGQNKVMDQFPLVMDRIAFVLFVPVFVRMGQADVAPNAWTHILAPFF
jgi:hypothetical protein